MVKILHICSGFYNRQVYRHFFYSLKKINIAQFVYFPKRNWMQQPDFRKLGYEGYTFSFYTFWFKIFYFLKIKTYTNALINYFTKKNKTFSEYTVIHAHNLFVDGAIAYHLSKKYNIKYITAVRNADIKYLRYMPFLFSYGKKILESSEKIICISPTIKNKILFKYRKIFELENKINIIPNGIPEVFLNNTALLPKKRPDFPVKLIYVGSFLKQKNIHKIIEFVKIHNDKFHLTLIGGGGNYEKKILTLINNVNNINYLGRISDKKILIKEYRKADIFIMPSVNETFGLVYAEAMSQALPLIYSRNTGFDDFFQEGIVGYPVNPSNIDDYLIKISLILMNYESISESCILNSKQFDWNKIALKYNFIYSKI